MSEILASTGVDAWIRDDKPNRNQSGGNVIRLQSGHRKGLIRIPVTNIRGRTILSATLTGHAHGSFDAQTVTVHAVVDKWVAGTVNWNNAPTIGAGVPTTVAACTDGTAVSLDVTSLITAVAAGTMYRGFLLTTNASSADVSNWASFDGSKPSWSLTIELSDAPEQPSDLRPDGGLAVGVASPKLAWSYVDLGGDSSEQGKFRVQADPAANGTSPLFDSGWVTDSTPELDLSTTTFSPLSAGDTMQWRVMTQDAGGENSVWSDWASWTYEPYPTLVMDSPTGGVIGDATPDVLFHLTGETLDHWRVRILDTEGNVLWGSGLRTGAGAITVPKRDENNKRIIKRDDATYIFEVRAWGSVERSVCVGAPRYVEELVSVVFDEGVVVAPSDFTITPAFPGDPRNTYTWFRSEAADGWLLISDGEIVARLDDEVTVSAGTYSWTDDGRATPRETHTWHVRAVESGHRSPASNAVVYTSKPMGAWIVPGDGVDPIKIRQVTSFDQFVTNDRRVTYSPYNLDSDTDIVYGLEGVSGTFQGTISRHPGDPDPVAAVHRLREVRTDFSDRHRFVYATRSIPVILRNLTVEPSSQFTDDNWRHNVMFTFIQDGD